MKRAFPFWLAVFLLLPLCACSAASAYTVTRDGTDYAVDREARTVSDGEYTYQYTFSGDSGEYDLEITYPDGSTYWWRQSRSGMGYGGWSDDHREDCYAKGDALRAVLLVKAPRSSGRYTGASLFLLAVGLFAAFAPRAAWYVGCGWRFKDAEPSELALLAGRGSGIIAVIAAVALLFL